MNKTLIAISLGTLFITMSCTGDLAGPVSSPGPVRFNASFETGNNTARTSLGVSSPGIREVRWSGSDRIKVFNSQSAAGSVFGIADSESYDPAPTATFEGEIAGSGPFYAVYPPEDAVSLDGFDVTVTLPPVQTYAAGGFADGCNPAVGYAETAGGSMHFRNLCGILKLRLKSSADVTAGRIVITSMKESEALCGTFKVSDIASDPILTCLSGGRRDLTLDLGSGVELGFEPEDFYFTVPEGAFAEGMVVSVYSVDGSTIGTVMTRSKHPVARAAITGIAAMDIFGKSANLSASGSSNCYIVPAAGRYMFNAGVRGNGGPDENGNASSGMKPTAVSHLWTSLMDQSSPAATAVIKNLKLEGTYAIFEASGTAGNAVIAVKSGSTVLWSWHIWVPSELPGDETYATGEHFLDRSLGAISKGTGCALLYQWGRKDPFNAPKAFTMNPAFSFKDTNASVGTVDYSVKNPTVFIRHNSSTEPSSNGNWIYGTEWPELWKDGTKGIYDPCPPGYMVPSAGDHGKVGLYTSFHYTGNGLNSGYPELLPISRTGGTGTNYITWTSSRLEGELQAYGIKYDTGKSVGAWTSYACPVRCVKEKNSWEAGNYGNEGEAGGPIGNESITW